MNSFNSELVKSLESLKERRTGILGEIQKEEKRKNELEKEMNKLREELDQVTDSLQKKYEIRGETDKLITNTETAFLKLYESSQTLLAILKRDEANLVKLMNSEK